MYVRKLTFKPENFHKNKPSSLFFQHKNTYTRAHTLYTVKSTCLKNNFKIINVEILNSSLDNKLKKYTYIIKNSRI